MAITIVQAIRRMRGGAQSQLMLGADGNLWVVKFRNNPQHLRVLANELIATRLAAAVGLSVPQSDVVDVSDWLIANSAGMLVDRERGRSEACAAGLNFGSRFVGGLMPGQLLDYLPEEQLADVRNVAEFAGMLALDKWTGNCNGRQAVFERRPRERRYRAVFIDQGYCFNAGEWSFPDAPLRGIFARNAVYARVRGWDDFEPWLSRLESLAEGTLWQLADEVPPAWYGGDPAAIERLFQQLLTRRSRIRELIDGFRRSDREPFPLWGARTATSYPAPALSAGLGAAKFVM